MEKIGTIVYKDETPNTNKFFFLIEKEVKKGEYIEIINKNIIGYVNEVISINKYFENVENIANYEKKIEFEKHFPIKEWEFKIAEVKILGEFKDGQFKRTFIPPCPGDKIKKIDKSILKKFLGLDENGLNIGKIQHHNLDAKINLTKLLQKHFAILAMSGAGKSYLTYVILEELLKRDENKTPSIILIDIHGEYLSIKKQFPTRVNIIKADKQFKFPTSKLKFSRFHEWLDLSDAQANLLHEVLEKMYGEKYSIDEIIKKIDSTQAKTEVKTVLKRKIKDLERLCIFSNEEERPNLDNLKLGELTIFDLSNVIYMKKKQIIVSLILRELFEKRRRNKIPPFFVIIEEAHNFAQEKVEQKQMITKNVIETIAREGRKFGASLALITQRPINLSKTALSQCNTHIFLRITNPSDLDHIQKSSEGIDSKIIKTITSLKTGECVIVGEAINAPVFIDVRKIDGKRDKNKKLEDMLKEFSEKRKQKSEDALSFL